MVRLHDDQVARDKSFRRNLLFLAVAKHNRCGVQSSRQAFSARLRAPVKVCVHSHDGNDGESKNDALRIIAKKGEEERSADEEPEHRIARGVASDVAPAGAFLLDDAVRAEGAEAILGLFRGQTATGIAEAVYPRDWNNRRIPSLKPAVYLFQKPARRDSRALVDARLEQRDLAQLRADETRVLAVADLLVSASASGVDGRTRLGALGEKRMRSVYPVKSKAAHMSLARLNPLNKFGNWVQHACASPEDEECGGLSFVGSQPHMGEKHMRPSRFHLLLAGISTMIAQPYGAAAAEKVFKLEEATIADIREAISSGALTSEKLVDFYVARIAAYDRAGPRLNSIIAVNPSAKADAAALDKERAEKGPRGPLHGIPVLLKDNVDAINMPTTKRIGRHERRHTSGRRLDHKGASGSGRCHPRQGGDG